MDFTDDEWQFESFEDFDGQYDDRFEFEEDSEHDDDWPDDMCGEDE